MIPPDIKANQLLARKYDFDFSDLKSNGENNEDNIEKALVNISINTSGMTLRELQQLESPLNKPDIEVTAKDKTDNES